MPSQYLILRQGAPGSPCEVVFYDSDKQTRELMFTGNRWSAKRFLSDLRAGIGWENVPAFNERIVRGRNVCTEIIAPTAPMKARTGIHTPASDDPHAAAVFNLHRLRQGLS